MALVWTMVGASTPYQLLLGAIANAAISIRIMALNYCYDIPVKRTSTHFFLFSCVLIFSHLSRDGCAWALPAKA